MAKSSDLKNKQYSIDDDLIKDALKTGLKSIEASDTLTRKTLESCFTEIDKLNKNKGVIKNTGFSLVYKVGMPLAAGALIMVLVFRGNILRRSLKATDSVPEACSDSTANVLKSETLAAGENCGTASMDISNEAYKSAQAPEVSVKPSYTEDGGPGSQDMEEKGQDKDNIRDIGPSFSLRSVNIKGLNSGFNSTQDVFSDDFDSYEVFNAITRYYNEQNNMDYVLDITAAVQINSLLDDGVSAETLLEAKSYRDIISGKGYWALPLEKEGVINTVLIVSKLDKNKPFIPISNNDITYSYNNEYYIITVHPEGSYIGANLEGLFDADVLTTRINKMGYENISELIVADINYGSDFIAFITADDKELAIPLAINPDLFGIENMKVYYLNELFEIIANNLE
jgi:hypothetical protein